MKKNLFLIGFLVLRTSLPSAAPIPRPDGFVVDAASVLSERAERGIAALLAEVERVSGIEVAVVTVPSLEGLTETDYAQVLFDRWRIGKRGKDNGVLLFMALRERRVRIHVGYGLEEALPDGLCGEILDRHFLPAASREDFDTAFAATVQAVVGALADFYGFKVGDVGEGKEGEPSTGIPWWFIVLLLVLLTGRGWLPFPVFVNFGGFGGGGFGGGGFGGRGGFGGFGGGLSGGGGAGRGF